MSRSLTFALVTFYSCKSDFIQNVNRCTWVDHHLHGFSIYLKLVYWWLPVVLMADRASVLVFFIGDFISFHRGYGTKFWSTNMSKITNFSASVASFSSRWARIFLGAYPSQLPHFREDLFVCLHNDDCVTVSGCAVTERNRRFGCSGDSFVWILLTESFPVAFTPFACFALSSNALPNLNRASSVGFSPSARRRSELEVHVKIMCSLITLSMSLNSQVFASWRSLVW